MSSLRRLIGSVLGILVTLCAGCGHDNQESAGNKGGPVSNQHATPTSNTNSPATNTVKPPPQEPEKPPPRPSTGPDGETPQ